MHRFFCFTFIKTWKLVSFKDCFFTFPVLIMLTIQNESKYGVIHFPSVHNSVFNYTIAENFKE